jgi:hypothetical protein
VLKNCLAYSSFPLMPSNVINAVAWLVVIPGLAARQRGQLDGLSLDWRGRPGSLHRGKHPGGCRRGPGWMRLIVGLVTPAVGA